MSERKKKAPGLFSNLFVYFSFSSFVALLKPLAWDDSAWQPPSSLPHTFPLAIRNYHTVRVLACPKATAGLIFFGLAPLWHAWEGQGKEMGGPAALLSPRAGLGEASPVFFDSVELVREHSPSGSNKSSMRLRNWNCLTCLGTWSLIQSFCKTTGKSLRAVLKCQSCRSRAELCTLKRTKLTLSRPPRNPTGLGDGCVV